MAELVVDGKTESRNLIYLVPDQAGAIAGGAHQRRTDPGGGWVPSETLVAGAGPKRLCDLWRRERRTSDNYFDLLPGETVDVVVKGRETLDALKANLQVVSLADAFKAANTGQ